MRKRLMRQLRRDRERMRQRQEDIDRGRLRCRARTIEEVLTTAEGSATGQACEECASDARRAGSILPGGWGMESEAGVQTNEEEAGEAAEGRGWNGGSRKRRLGGGGKEGGRGAC